MQQSFGKAGDHFRRKAVDIQTAERAGQGDLEPAVANDQQRVLRDVRPAFDDRRVRAEPTGFELQHRTKAPDGFAGSRQEGCLMSLDVNLDEADVTEAGEMIVEPPDRNAEYLPRAQALAGPWGGI